MHRSDQRRMSKATRSRWTAMSISVSASRALRITADGEERGEVASFRYDDFARPESELIDESGCRRVAEYMYDN